jgi:hypothetical protein
MSTAQGELAFSKDELAWWCIAYYAYFLKKLLALQLEAGVEHQLPAATINIVMVSS